MFNNFKNSNYINAVVVLLSWMVSYFLANFILSVLPIGIFLRLVLYQYSLTIIPLVIIFGFESNWQFNNFKLNLKNYVNNLQQTLSKDLVELVLMVSVPSLLLLLSVLLRLNHQLLLTILLLPNNLFLVPLLASLVFVKVLPETFINLYQYARNKVGVSKVIVYLILGLCSVLFAMVYYQLQPASLVGSGGMLAYLILGGEMQYVYLKYKNLTDSILLFSLFLLFTVWF